MLMAIQNLKNFRGAGNPLWSTERYKFLEFIVVALWVEEANLIVSLDQPFDDRGHRRGLATSGRAGDDQPRSVRLQVKSLSRCGAAQQDLVMLQPRRKARQIFRQQFVD